MAFECGCSDAWVCTNCRTGFPGEVVSLGGDGEIKQRMCPKGCHNGVVTSQCHWESIQADLKANELRKRLEAKDEEIARWQKDTENYQRLYIDAMDRLSKLGAERVEELVTGRA